MTYTKERAAENRTLYREATAALKRFGWQPEPEPQDWRTLLSLVVETLSNDFPGIPHERVRHQVARVMAEYRGYKKAEWK